MSTRLSLDRFEGKGKQIAVLLTDDGEALNLPRSILPPGTQARRRAQPHPQARRRGEPPGRPRNPPGARQAGGTRPGWRHQAVKIFAIQDALVLLLTGARVHGGAGT